MNGASIKPRVAFLLAYPGLLRGGGIWQSTITIANKFAKRGVNVDLVLMQRAEGLSPDLFYRGVNVVNLRPYINRTTRFKIHWTNLRLIFSLCNYIINRKPQALIASLITENLRAIIAKKLTSSNCRVVISQHNVFSWGIKRSRLIWPVRRLYPCADAVIAVSQGVAEDLLQIVPGIRTKLKVIYNPVDVERIQQLSLAEPDHPWFESKSHQVILGVGRLERRKDFPTLVKAFLKVRQTKPVKLVILGEGVERQQLEMLVTELGLENDVSLPGFAPNPYSYISRSAVLVLSSVTEGFSYVLLEALACGCPVVSTDCPSGPREILEDGKWGRLVPVGDVDAMAKAIERTLEQPLPSEQLKCRARFFSVDKAVNQYLKVAVPNCF